MGLCKCGYFKHWCDIHGDDVPKKRGRNKEKANQQQREYMKRKKLKLKENADLVELGKEAAQLKSTLKAYVPSGKCDNPDCECHKNENIFHPPVAPRGLT